MEPMFILHLHIGDKIMAKIELKKGDKITMYFRACGVVSEEEVTIISVDEKTITIDNTWHPDKSDDEENGKFNRKNGKCLNDNTMFGASRFINPM
jgi:hypothetical protein